MTYLGKSIKGDLSTDQGNTGYSSTAKTWAPAETGRTGCSVELPDGWLGFLVAGLVLMSARNPG